MPKLPVLSGSDAVRAFAKAGFRESRRRGSHVMMVRDECPNTLSIPQHNELRAGLLRALIRNAEMSVEEFIELI
ncbi:MAG TPA: type II toxin-antitoxin system HicA family toxin [Phycisphaerae bacterium]|nr:type II toxin-antitoxin system HicA family toxin [Phycisphaerales bacterium]HRX84031.1 type II toxin-antitoxin system HicA family toxin [Phycisphaerae bacterium]